MKIFAILLCAATTLLTSCLGPSTNAPVAPYHEPGGPRSAYRGMPNPVQMQHLHSTVFPRLTDQEHQLLRWVNRTVNRDIHYLSDLMNYGVADFHVTEPPVRRPLHGPRVPAGYGDCEDFALTKKHRLKKLGFSPSRTFVALATVPENGGRTRHSVLAVPEGGEWWILNNWDNRIERASSLERWWGWEFIRPRYAGYLRSAQRADAVASGSGGGTRARQ